MGAPVGPDTQLLEQVLDILFAELWRDPFNRSDQPPVVVVDIFDDPLGLPPVETTGGDTEFKRKF